MPGGDRTGPYGAGPRTGRAAGYCTGYDMPGFANRGGYGWGRGMGWGRGGGWGRGRGRGWGRGPRVFQQSPQFGEGWGPAFYSAPAPSPESEVTMLKDQAAQMEQALLEIKERISELEKE